MPHDDGRSTAWRDVWPVWPSRTAPGLGLVVVALLLSTEPTGLITCRGGGGTASASLPRQTCFGCDDPERSASDKRSRPETCVTLTGP